MKETKILEKLIFTPIGGEPQEFEDINEFNGVIAPLSAEHEDFVDEQRMRVLKIIGANDEVLGYLKQPWQSNYETHGKADDMRQVAVDHLLSTDSHCRSIMAQIEKKAEAGEFSMTFTHEEITGYPNPWVVRDLGSEALNDFNSKARILDIFKHFGYHVHKEEVKTDEYVYFIYWSK